MQIYNIFTTTLPQPLKNNRTCTKRNAHDTIFKIIIDAETEKMLFLHNDEKTCQNGLLRTCSTFDGTLWCVCNVSIKEGISDSLFLSILSSDLLWDKIRAKGGAYGTGALADVIERTYHFYSYRDPRLDETYEDIFSAIKEETLDDDKLTSAILQRKANDLKPLAPSQKSKIYLRRRLFSISDDYRRKVKSSLDLVTMRDVENARERILSSLEREHSVAVLASHKMVEASRYFKEGEDLPF